MNQALVFKIEIKVIPVKEFKAQFLDHSGRTSVPKAVPKAVPSAQGVGADGVHAGLCS